MVNIPGRPKGAKNRPIPDPWQPFCKACNGVLNMTKLLGVSYGTWARWREGQEPSPEHAAKIRSLASGFGVAPPC